MCQVQIEVIQKRQKEKKAMMSAVKKYQKGEVFFRRVAVLQFLFFYNFHCTHKGEKCASVSFIVHGGYKGFMIHKIVV